MIDNQPNKLVKFTMEEINEFFRIKSTEIPIDGVKQGVDNPALTVDQLGMICGAIMGSGFAEYISTCLKAIEVPDGHENLDNKLICGVIISSIASGIQLGREFETYRNMWTLPVSDKVN